MIEQTEFLIKEWSYIAPALQPGIDEVFSNFTSLHVMKKRAANKKGLACRYTSKFVFKNETVLTYIGENSYVIDLEDTIDKNELLRMLRNSYTQFDEKFQLRKVGTILKNASLTPLEESSVDVASILPLLA